jgi:hypothetical protein
MTWHPDECRAWEERAEEYVEGDAELAVGEVASEHEAFIAVQAMLMAPHDELLQSLLIQEARIAVWQIDPTRLRADNVRYIRRAIITAERAAFWREFRDSGGKKRDRDVGGIAAATGLAPGSGGTACRQGGGVVGAAAAPAAQAEAGSADTGAGAI